MNLDELQETVDSWIQAHGSGRYRDKFTILARMMEELGELAYTLQHTEGLRLRKTDVRLEEELGDLLFTLAVFANASGLRLTDCLSGVMEKYQSQDSPEW